VEHTRDADALDVDALDVDALDVDALETVAPPADAPPRRRFATSKALDAKTALQPDWSQRRRNFRAAQYPARRMVR
jgi:hypothetical protein